LGGVRRIPIRPARAYGDVAGRSSGRLPKAFEKGLNQHGTKDVMLRAAGRHEGEALEDERHFSDEFVAVIGRRNHLNDAGILAVGLLR